jgi:DNA-binding protein HU-beta
LTRRSRASRRKPRNRRQDLLDTPGSVAYNACTLKIRVPRSAGWLASPPANLLTSGGHVTMNKHELIAKIAQDTGITKTSATAAVESFFDGITKSLKKGQPITFVGFGTFKTAQRKARTARNPQTGAAIKVPKRRVVRFSAGKALKGAVN